MDLITTGVFVIVFLAVTLVGLRAAYWRGGGMGTERLAEWGMAGRRFGTTTAWFLLGGTIFTGNSMLAIPGLVYAKGAQGFYTLTYLVLVYPLLFVVLSRFWLIARHRGYLTAADFVRERFGRSVALLVALTGILATMPYLAVQIYGIEVVLGQLGLPVEASLIGAFLLLSLSTYIGGLRAPALMAILKDGMVILIILLAWIVVPLKLGGPGYIFAVVQQKAVQNPAVFSPTLFPSQYIAYGTQVLGASLALFLYPHIITVFNSVNSAKVLKRNAILLQFYTVLTGMAGVLGYMALVAGIAPSPVYKTNSAVPALFAHFFPGWFAGFAFAALALCSLVPAAIMSIAVANLVSRNIYREYLHPSCTEKQELRVARWASFFVKGGALIFILFVPTTFANNLQLMGGVWIVQIFPAVFLGLYTRWFHRRALVVGWVGGMVGGTWMVAQQGFAPSYPFTFGGTVLPVYAGLAALLVNLLLVVMLTPLFNWLGIARGKDVIPTADFERATALQRQPVWGKKRAPQPMNL